MSTTPPNSNFVLPFGQAISRTTYATLRAMIGDTFGAGDGSTTFNIPDLRGRVIAGLDNMGGSAANRITNAGSGIVGTTIGAAGGAETVALSLANLPPITPTGTITNGAITSSINASPSGLIINQSAGGSAGLGGGGQAQSALNNFGVTSTQAISTFTGAAGGRTSAGVNKMPPAIVLPMLLRVI